MFDRLFDLASDPKTGRIPSVYCRASTFRSLGYLKWLLFAGAVGAFAFLRVTHRPFEWAQLAVLLPFVALHFIPLVVKNDPPRSGGGDPLAVFALVHGTFALNAPWTRPTSLLCETLQEQFGGRAAFESFQWTGGNRMRDRSDAAVELRDFLEHVVAAYPASRPIVIAHSHGGNVSRAALARLPNPERIGGLVCLSTPFLNLHPRALGSYGLLCLKGIVTAPLFLFVFWFVEQPFLYSAAAVIGDGNILKILLFVLGLAGFLMFAVVAPLVVMLLVLKAHALLAAEPAEDPVPLLLIRASSDEASIALLAMQFGGLVAQRAWYVVTFCAAPFVKVARTTTKSADGTPGDIRFGQAGLIALAISFLGISALGIIACVPMLAALVFMNVAGAGIGISGLLLEVSVEAAPEGSHTLMTLPSPAALVTMEELTSMTAGAEVALSHSVHSRPEVGGIVAGWLAPMLGSSPKTPDELYTLAPG